MRRVIRLQDHPCLGIYNSYSLTCLYNSFIYIQRGFHSSNKKDDKSEQKHVPLYEIFYQKFNKIKQHINTALQKHDANDILQRIMLYVENISRMTDVRISRARVDEINEEIRRAVMKKRKIIRDLDKTNKEFNSICKQIRTSSNEEYLALVRMEINLSKKGQMLHEDMSMIDDLEQELFNKLLRAVNEAYDKERMHTNFIRILGLLSVIISSILTLSLSHQRNQLINIRDELERVTVENPPPKESWGSYAKRHTKWMYSWYTK